MPQDSNTWKDKEPKLYSWLSAELGREAKQPPTTSIMAFPPPHSEGMGKRPKEGTALDRHVSAAVLCMLAETF